VAIAVDGQGRAVLSPIDVTRGVFGPEELLAPLTSLTLGGDPTCAARPDQARVVLPFDSEIGLDRSQMPGIYASGTYGIAVVRWSASQACLDAIELSVRDERHELDVGYYEPPGTSRKIIGIFGPSGAVTRAPAKPSSGSTPKTAPFSMSAGNATLALVLHGAELRQRLACTGVGP
jgi:hypothetical protein